MIEDELNRLMRPPKVCLCKNVSEHDIRKLFRKKGKLSLQEVIKITNASTGCGTCIDRLAEIVTEFQRSN